MSDELDAVVRALEAERYGRSVWWRTDRDNNPDQRLRELERALDTKKAKAS